MANQSVSFKRKEARTLRFTIKDVNGDPVNVAAATLTFGVKRIKSDPTYIFPIKSDDTFDKTLAASGIVTVPISASDTDQDQDLYTGELKTLFSSSNIDKSADIDFTITDPVIPD